jgi:hypothetical protein
VISYVKIELAKSLERARIEEQLAIELDVSKMLLNKVKK